jgi:hypothetical protein
VRRGRGASAERLRYTSYSVDGAIVDAFELKKTGAESNDIDHAPAPAAASSATGN